jgi:hypothetical protein
MFLGNMNMLVSVTTPKFQARSMRDTEDMVEFQLTQMHDRLPPLSAYQESFTLDDWQCRVLQEVAMNNLISSIAFHTLPLS